MKLNRKLGIVYNTFIVFLLFVFPFNNVTAAENGKWVKNRDFSQVNIGCIQTWTCHPKSDILHDASYFVAVTKPQVTNGICSAGGGAIDSCNVCLASEPNIPCKWELRKRR